MRHQVLAYMLVMACGVAFIYIFSSILLTGGYMAIESNIFILWAEIVMSLFLFGFGLYCFLVFLRNIK